MGPRRGPVFGNAPRASIPLGRKHLIRTQLHKKDYGGGMKFVDVDQTAVSMTHEEMQGHAHVR
jgi:hypothetical protein